MWENFKIQKIPLIQIVRNGIEGMESIQSLVTGMWSHASFLVPGMPSFPNMGALLSQPCQNLFQIA